MTLGASQLGTLDAPVLPVSLNQTRFFRNGLELKATNNNPYLQPLPNGTVRPYNLTIKRATIAPDGQEKPCILIDGGNGTVPRTYT